MGGPAVAANAVELDSFIVLAKFSPRPGLRCRAVSDPPAAYVHKMNPNELAATDTVLPDPHSTVHDEPILFSIQTTWPAVPLVALTVPAQLVVSLR
jgi:hypothetical protein